MDLPDLTDLQGLTSAAIVTYAVRCVMRVRPLYHLPENHPEKEIHEAALDDAITIVSRSLRYAPNHFIRAAQGAARAGAAADATGDEASANVAYSIANAANTAAYTVADEDTYDSVIAYMIAEADANPNDTTAFAAACAAAGSAGYAANLHLSYNAYLHAVTQDLKILSDSNQITMVDFNPTSQGDLWHGQEPDWFTAARPRMRFLATADSVHRDQ